MKEESEDSGSCIILLVIREGKCIEINNSHDIEISAALCQIVEDTDILIHSIYEDICANEAGGENRYLKQFKNMFLDFGF